MVKYLLPLLVIIFVGFLIFAAANRKEIRPSGLFLHQNYIESEALFNSGYSRYSGNNRSLESLESVDLRSENGVFWHVFSQLPEEVTVYPSENYFYFSFQVAPRFPKPIDTSIRFGNPNIESALKEIWGNIRLSPPERDQGILHFAYWEFIENPQSSDDGFSKYKQFSQKDGLRVEKLFDFRYAVTYRGQTVIFNLYDLPQTPPKLAKLRDNEVFAQRTFDESGFRFFLVFQEDLNHFMYILDEEVVPDGFRESIENLSIPGIPNIDSARESALVIDPRTGFAFYNDEQNNRKILIGVSAENVRKNNYFDGPFDQLADNYVYRFPESIDVSIKPVGYYIEKAYLYTQSRIDDYGKFLDTEGSRVAISPYYAYEMIEEAEALIAACQKTKVLESSEFYRCITTDDKENY